VSELTAAERAAHNAAQRRYFEETEKPRTVPTGSPYVRRQVDELVRFAGLEPGQRILEDGAGLPFQLFGGERPRD
jgi:hypothetical protein